MIPQLDLGPFSTDTESCKMTTATTMMTTTTTTSGQKLPWKDDPFIDFISEFKNCEKPALEFEVKY